MQAHFFQLLWRHYWCLYTVLYFNTVMVWRTVIITSDQIRSYQHIISQTFAMAPINQSSSAPHVTNTIVA